MELTTEKNAKTELTSGKCNSPGTTNESTMRQGMLIC
jgi:hypothetical protein